MQFFIPGLLLFLLAVVVSFVALPRFTPLIVALMSIVFLVYGVYNHYKMFGAEYRLSTWQNSFKIYAPAIMIASIILFIIYAILSFFTMGSVPVPVIPNVIEPNINSATNQVIKSLNRVGNLFTQNRNTDVLSGVNNQINTVNKNRTNILGLKRDNQTGETNTNKRGNTISRSFLETI